MNDTQRKVTWITLLVLTLPVSFFWLDIWSYLVFGDDDWPRWLSTFALADFVIGSALYVRAGGKKVRYEHKILYTDPRISDPISGQAEKDQAEPGRGSTVPIGRRVLSGPGLYEGDAYRVLGPPSGEGGVVAVERWDPAALAWAKSETLPLSKAMSLPGVPDARASALGMPTQDD